MITFYKDSGLVFNLSRIDEWIETFGLTILRGYGIWYPRNSSSVGGPTELVKEWQMGFHISSYNTKENFNKILELSENHFLCHEISKNCIKESYNFSFSNFEKK